MIKPAAKFILEGVGTFLVLIALGVAALAWRLSSGPISLGFLTPYVKDALLIGQDDGYKVEVRDTVLTWAGWERTLDIRVTGVTVHDAKGARIVALPEIAVGISAAGLMKGMIAPTSLDLLAPGVRVLRRTDGSFAIDAYKDDDDEDSEAVMRFLKAAADDFLKPPDRKTPLGYLKRMGVLDGDFIVRDEASGATWRIPNFSLAILRDAVGISARAEGDVIAENAKATVSATAEYRMAERDTAWTVEFNGVTPALFTQLGEPVKPLNMAQFPVGGTVKFQMDGSGATPEVAFDLAGGPGEIAAPDVFAEAIPVDQFVLKGAYRFAAKQLAVEDFYFRAKETAFDANGLLEFAEAGLGVKLFGTVVDLPAGDIGRYWPKELSRTTRAWVSENIGEGRITDGRVVIAIEPGMIETGELPANAVDLKFDFTGLSARYMRTMPPIVDAVGEAKMTARTLDIYVESAETGKDLRLREGAVHIDGIGSKGASTAEIEVVVTGPVESALRVLDNEPLQFPTRFGLLPANVDGLVASRAKFRLPLRSTISVGEVDFSAVADVEEASVSGLFGGSKLEKGNLRLTIDRKGIESEGEVEIAGAPFHLVWTEDFEAPEGRPSSRYVLTSTLDETHRAKLGMPFAASLKGLVNVRFEIAGEGPKTGKGAGVIDFSAAGIDLAAIGWRKPAGQPGQVGLSFRLTEEETRVEAFEIKGGGLEAAGHLVFGGVEKEGEFQLDYVRIGDTNVTGAVRLDKDGGYAITLLGAAIDARPMINEALAAGRAKPSTATLPDIRFDAGVERLIAHNGVIVRNVTASLVHAGGRWRSAEVHGFHEKNKSIDMSIVESRDARALTVASGDAGAVIRGIDMYSNARGGALAIEATVNDRLAERPIVGRVEMRNFVVVRAPGLANLLTVGSLTGIARLLGGDGISFRKLEAPFDYRSGLLRLGESRAVGSALGLTLSGLVDRNLDAIDLNGTIIPAYTINNVISKLPLIGLVLAGGKEEGVFAFTYHVRGPVGAPEIKVNPLSALAPGLIRKIVSGDGSGDKREKRASP